jgi:hypothetical protein
LAVGLSYIAFIMLRYFKKLTKPTIEENFLTLIENSYKNPKVDIIDNGQKLNVFP